MVECYTPSVVTLRQGKLPEVVGARVETKRLSVELGQHCSHVGSGGVHFHNERELRIRMGAVQKAFCSFRVPRQRLGIFTEHGSEGGARED